MDTDNSTDESHRARSRFCRRLIQSSNGLNVACALNKSTPKVIVQFWDDLNQLPEDVSDCLETWKKTEELGFKRILFDKHQARKFISQGLGPRYKQAYDKCYHPAMQSDYFRLCYIFLKGGCYIDADDVYEGLSIQHLFDDDRLKIQPLCYDMETNSMVPPSSFAKPGINKESWIFYFNNNPLISGSEHPLIKRALNEATLSLEKSATKNSLPEIQSTTGPGNLTKSIFEAITENSGIEQSLIVLTDWEKFAKSRWELSYRNDLRNWRHSNRRGYP